ncbi:hypothetical protein [Cysteiniphilum marinum]|uniref:hypothetical protein n=1 Tax=Cysteiniphilum marinum TaxID=2774191 RepID=UPI00193B13ED|nr:hypothetical protein [Cysteiniphilum marinum]
MTDIKVTREIRESLYDALTSLISDIGPIKIGNAKQFPFGWRKAAKGRTVWRILEEVITQNLEESHNKYGFNSMKPSESEVSVFDFAIKMDGHIKPIYVNIKSAVKGARKNKDDISKAIGLKHFYEEDPEKEIFIASFVINFKDNMSISIDQCHVMPIAWLPDIYVNPSNNGNLQSSKYKDVDLATERTNQEFIDALVDEMEVARKKRLAKSRS